MGTNTGSVRFVLGRRFALYDVFTAAALAVNSAITRTALYETIVLARVRRHLTNCPRKVAVLV